MGALAATYCLEQAGPQGHSYTPAEFVARFRTFFDDQGKLDVLTCQCTVARIDDPGDSSRSLVSATA